MSAGVRGLKPGTLVTCRVGKGPCPPPQRTAWALRQTGLPCGLTEAGIVGPQPRGEGLSLDGITLDRKGFSSSQFRDFSASLPHAQASCMGSRPSARPYWTMAPSADLCPRRSEPPLQPCIDRWESSAALAAHWVRGRHRGRPQRAAEATWAPADPGEAVWPGPKWGGLPAAP